LQSEALESELERAHRVWRTKFTQPPTNAREWARQARFLQGRGFAAEVIRKLLKEIPDESAQG
jgi:regulatory protein